MTAGHDTVGVRAPAGKVARGLIERTGQPIAAPSANRANRISPTRAEHVLADLDGRIDLIIDSGPTALGLESTVLDLTTRHHGCSAQDRSRSANWRAALGESVIEPVATSSDDRLVEPRTDAGPLRALDHAVPCRFDWGTRKNGSLREHGASRDR